MSLTAAETHPSATAEAPRSAVLLVACTAGVVVAAALAVLVGFGMSATDAGLALLYEVGFVVLPGVAVVGALAPRPAGFGRVMVLGWATGYALEALAFGATAALGVRGILPAYPVLVVGAALVVARRRGQSLTPPAPTVGRPTALGLGAVLLLALAWLAVEFFAAAPLPGSVPVANHPADVVFSISLVGEALHHWPLTNPTVAGVALPYHDFAYLHMAAMSQVTGIDPSVLVMRWFVVPVVGLELLGVAAAASMAGFGTGVGVLAAALVLLATEVDLDARAQLPFLGLSLTVLWVSPPGALGQGLLLPTFGLVAEMLRRPPEHRGAVGPWVLLALLVFGCSGAKSSTIPVLAGGVAVVVAWQLLRHRRIDWVAVGALAVLLPIYGAFWVVKYGGQSRGSGLNPFAPWEEANALAWVREIISAEPGLRAAMTVVVVCGLLAAPLVGLAALAAVGRQRRAAEAALGTLLAVGMLAASILIASLLNAPGGGQLSFVWHGFAVACVPAAAGYLALWQAARWRLGRTATIAAAIGWIAFVGAVAWFTDRLAPDDIDRYPRWIGGLALGLAVVALGAGRLNRSVGASAAAASAALLLAMAFNTPLDVLPSRVAAWKAGTPAYDTTGRAVTPALARAMTWVRRSTPTDAVLAVNNQFHDVERTDPTFFYYSALAQRRVLLEGWKYTGLANERFEDPHPFAARERLNRALFAGDAAALRAAARRFDVRYLVVDRARGGAAPALDALARPAYRNRELSIFAVRNLLRGRG